MPVSFDFGDYGGGAARLTPTGRSVGAVDWFQVGVCAVSVLRNLWWQMQVR